MVTFDDVRDAATLIDGIAHRTPVLHSTALDATSNNTVFLKCENFQRGGAFKFRGAYNALNRLSPDERARGVVAFSSGNHAQGVALAAKLLDIRATIVMPDFASRVKLEATRGSGAEVITYGPGESREEIADRLRRERNATLIPPFDHPHVIAGQGTAALELLNDVENVDVLVVPVGGGGLISGSALVAKALRPAIKVVGVEPAAADDWARSRRAGKRISIEDPDTIAEGLKTTSPGELTWPIAGTIVDDFVTVSDDEIRAAMRLLFERVKIVVEPAGAASVAAALFGKTGEIGKRVGVIISGGNVDRSTFAKLIG